jgi:two-component system, LuxR family, sensor kinase FixL
MSGSTPNRPAVPWTVWLLAGALVGATLVVDLFTPVGIAMGSLYALAVLTGLWARSRAFVISIAALCLVLIFVGLAASPDSSPVSVGYLNRGLSIGLLAVVTAVVLYKQRLNRELEDTHTALDHSQHDLDASNQLMAAVVESTVEGIITIGTHGIIQSANRAAREMFGYSAQELIGRNVSMLMPSPDRERHDSYLKHYLETGSAGIIGKGREVIGVRKNGELFPIHLSVSDVKGEPRFFTGVLRELTKERQMQRKLLEQEALATLGKMAAVVAHEVKNPLAGVSGVIQVLQSRTNEGTEEHEIMDEVLERIDALVRTIEDMLLFARPRALKLEKVRATELIQETAHMLQQDGRFEDVHFEIPDRPVVLELDADYFRQALLNLFLNAGQAMEGRGLIRADVSVEDGLCRITVSDHGPGIPESIRNRMFEPFFTTKGRGTGLGLSLVKSIVERHGGEVNIHCPETGGTLVSITIPGAQAEAPSHRQLSLGLNQP